MKEVNIISKVVGRAVDSTSVPSAAAPAASVDLSGYLPRSVWDAVWEVRETEDGTRYLFGKVPLVLQYGVTMYADGEGLDLPSIYAGLPIDGQTLYWEEEDGVKVLKAKGGSSGEGGSIEYPLSWSGFSSGSWDGSAAKTIYIPSKVSELTNDSAFITASALSGYATESWVTGKGYITYSALSGYATESWVTGKGYITYSALSGYLPLTGGTLTGNLYIDGAYAFMPMDSSYYGLYFAGLNVNLHKNHSYVRPIISLDPSYNVVFATNPMVKDIGYLATQSWVGTNYLPLSGGTITGSLTVNGDFYSGGKGEFTKWVTCRGNLNISGESGVNTSINFYSYDNSGYQFSNRVYEDKALNIYYRSSAGVFTEVVKIGSDGRTQMTSYYANPLILKRTHPTGGAYVKYFAKNQDILSMSAGVDNTHRFSVWYQDASQNIDNCVMWVDSSGNLLAYGGITMYSDERKKTILSHVQLSLREVADAPLIEHYYNSDREKTTHVGSIAQYWAGLNDWFCKMDTEGFYTMEIQNAALASAISVARELLKYETKTDKQIRKLKRRISELEEEVEQLKNK